MLKEAFEKTPFWAHVAAFLVGFVVVVFFFGCAAPIRKPPIEPAVSQPIPPITTVAPTPQLPQWEPAIERIPQREERVKEYKDIIGEHAATLIYRRDREYTLACSEWGSLAISFLPGDIYQGDITGNSGEWQIDNLTSSIDGLPTSVLAIKRGTYAPVTKVKVVTDKNIYLIKLVPSGKGDNRTKEMIYLYDPVAKERQREHAVAMEEQRRRKAVEPRYPSLNFATARTYRVSGDAVLWRPERVEGDHQRTFIKLPANTGAGVPTVTVLRDGQEQRVNARTIAESADSGPLIIVDEAFSEGKLRGDGGEITLTAGRN